MGDMNAILIKHFIFNKDYIDIDLAFTPTLTLRAAKLLFDFLARIVDCTRREIAYSDHRSIDKDRLISISNRFSAPEARPLGSLQKRPFKLKHRTLHHSYRVADVRTKSNQDATLHDQAP